MLARRNRFVSKRLTMSPPSPWLVSNQLAALSVHVSTSQVDTWILKPLSRVRSLAWDAVHEFAGRLPGKTYRGRLVGICNFTIEQIDVIGVHRREVPIKSSVIM